MVNNTPKVAEKEHREPLSVVDNKIEALVAQMKKSKYFIAFTGAEVSNGCAFHDSVPRFPVEGSYISSQPSHLP